MRWRKEHLKKCKLYLILDAAVTSYDEQLTIARESIEAGVDIIQYRDKEAPDVQLIAQAKKLRDICKDKVPFIVNDRVDVAVTVGADGVHIGQGDIPLIITRRIVGKRLLVGVSCQNEEHIRFAQNNGADYIGFGSVYKTETKPEREPMELSLLSSVVKDSGIPVYAIGGITVESIDPLRNLGVKHFAVCRGILQAADVSQSVSHFAEKIKKKAARA